MIKRFQHRGLERHYEKVRRILAQLKSSSRPEDMDLPGYKLHPLKGGLEGFWSVTVRANWRIIFCFENADATDVDLIDYH